MSTSRSPHHFSVLNPFRRKGGDEKEGDEKGDKEEFSPKVKEEKKEKKKEEKKEKEREKKERKEEKKKKGSEENILDDFLRKARIQKQKTHEEIFVPEEKTKKENKDIVETKKDETKEESLCIAKGLDPNENKEDILKDQKENVKKEKDIEIKEESLTAETDTEKLKNHEENLTIKQEDKKDKCLEKQSRLEQTTKKIKSMIFMKEPSHKNEEKPREDEEIVSNVDDIQKDVRVVIESVPKKKKKKTNFVKERLRRSGLKSHASGVSTSHMNSDDVTDRFFITDELPSFRKEQFNVTWDGFTKEQKESMFETKGTFIEYLDRFEKESKDQIIYIEDNYQIKFDDLYRNAKVFAKSLMCIDVSVKQPSVMIIMENGIHSITSALGVMLAGMSAVYVHPGSSIEMLKLIINKSNVRICLLDHTSMSFSDLWDIFDIILINVEGEYKEIYEPYEFKGTTEINNKLRHKLTQKMVEKIHPKAQPQFYDAENGEISIETENECVFTLESFLSRSTSVPDEMFYKKINSITTNSIVEIVFVPSKHGGYKGIIWTQGNVLSQTNQIITLFSLNNKTRILHHLPNSYYLERLFCFYIPIITRCSVSVIDSTSTRGLMIPFLKALERHRPSLLFSTPRVFEKLNKIVKQKKITKKCICVSTYLAKSTQAISIYTGICSPEACGFVTMNRPGCIEENTAGPALDDMHTQVNNGKLRVWGPSVTPGYVSGDVRGKKGVLLNPIVEMINVDGTKIYSVIGKVSPTIVTSNDVILHCPIIEDLIRKIQTIDNCLVVGDGKRCAGALLTVKENEVQKAFGPGDVRRNSEYMKWLKKRVVDLMAVFPSYMRIKRFIIVKDNITDEFPIQIKPHLTNEERIRLYNKFKKAIDMMYPNEPYCEK
ncbi:hypothetical protein ENU1_056980 [Entamoeba nuttalli P19]|uniref:AMP-dependent synthetase/ligase domain-containing protein n=1 Tax=Entamoeba nuttalli (strain P19) TaxID=1076696 RepID=K2HF12_ENTNP|nr:hypothetical protein ENU1_056980 [Entamoeba nuttalli P19]EKE41409.1 hypothetical protein ENU1_056980 [Entamoeba nuttalli P19]|eukprot:XP_008856258.1 hypothetical protein ENU1_056980 [Entamoeba nuttalli P19]